VARQAPAGWRLAEAGTGSQERVLRGGKLAAPEGTEVRRGHSHMAAADR